MPDTSLSVGTASLEISRKCAACDEEEKRKPAGPQAANDGLSLLGEVLRSPKWPLDASTRASFEPRFGHDFSRVRVHTGVGPAQSARDMNANAYTVGQNIVFSAGQFLPETQAGRQLLSHELTHVVQQSDARKPHSDGAPERGILSLAARPNGRTLQRQPVAAPQTDPQVAALVQSAVDELESDSPSERRLLSSFFAAHKLGQLKQWALALQAHHHHKQGNYLLMFFGVMQSSFPEDAGIFKREFQKVGIDIDAISLEWELHLQIIEEKSRPMKVELRNYPIYDWKVTVGGVLKPFAEVADVFVHFIPVFGEALSAIEALIGREILTGRKLQGWERLLAVIPYTGTILTAGKTGAQAILALARESGLTAETALELLRRTNTLAKDADRFREFEKIVQGGGELTSEQKATLRAAETELKPLESKLGAASESPPHGETETGGAKAPARQPPQAHHQPLSQEAAEEEAAREAGKSAEEGKAGEQSAEEAEKEAAERTARKARCYKIYLEQTAYCGATYTDDKVYELCMANAWKNYIRCLNGLPPLPLVPKK